MPETKSLLADQRFHEEANKVYKVPVSKLPKRQMFNHETEEIEDVIDYEDDKVLDLIVKFKDHHKEKQRPRLEELDRYTKGAHNIKYREPKPENRADNRIANPFPRFIIDFKTGVLLSEPIKYTTEESEEAESDPIAEKIFEVTKRNNDSYHNKLMADDMFSFGRAYELIGRDENKDEYYVKLPVEETFVVYDTSHRMNSLFAVHYYTVEFLDEVTDVMAVFANDGYTYYFTKDEKDTEYSLERDENGSATENSMEQHYFDAVQVNEWSNNEDRLGDFELVLDSIDAYDLNRSEMANYMQDLSEALLVIYGNPDTFKDEEGNLDTNALDYTMKHRIMIMGDAKVYDDETKGADPKAEYLTKSYDSQGVEAENNRIVGDILRFTNLIDFTDDNMGGNQTGVGLRFKGWGSDNDRKNKERMISKAIMRRLRLLANSWEKKEAVSGEDSKDLYDQINKVQIHFTPNIPQSDEEVMRVITGIDTVASEKTTFEMMSKLTGVSADTEKERVAEESQVAPQYDFENEGE